MPAYGEAHQHNVEENGSLDAFVQGYLVRGVFYTVAQVAWVALIFGPTPEPLVLPLFLALIVVEILVPASAERHGGTPWHRGHIAERYGLMTIIVLGESILAATVTVRAATAETGLTPAMVELVAGDLLIVSFGAGMAVAGPVAAYPARAVDPARTPAPGGADPARRTCCGGARPAHPLHGSRDPADGRDPGRSSGLEAGRETSGGGRLTEGDPDEAPD